MIGPAYAQSDVLAWLFQKRHQWITAAGAFAATAAVLFAIFQLGVADLIERTPLPVPLLRSSAPSPPGPRGARDRGGDEVSSGWSSGTDSSGSGWPSSGS